MRPVILHRLDLGTEDELPAIQRYFPGSTGSRTSVQRGDLVVGRYSVLPYYRELEVDLAHLGASLVNTYRQHRFVADLWMWTEWLEDLTPTTWQPQDVPADTPVVLKGETNSRKHQWSTHMFAQDRAAMGQVLSRLLDDSLIGQQEIYARRYVPLKTFMRGIGGVPITNEHRVFVYDRSILSTGYYWASHAEDVRDRLLGVLPDFSAGARALVGKVVSRLDGVPEEYRPRFYVVDVAETEGGEWIVVELNDGQMSGLSMNDPETLYRNLRRALAG